jgi:hypothetical protein
MNEGHSYIRYIGDKTIAQLCRSGRFLATVDFA